MRKIITDSANPAQDSTPECLTSQAINQIPLQNAAHNPKYDFLGQSYGSLYPNLHRYPATMLPQIGLELLRDFKASKTNVLDPFCGSGSSFASALEYGITNFFGFDLNPLAIMITKAKFSFIDSAILLEEKEKLLCQINKACSINFVNNITNADFWFPNNAKKPLDSILNLIFQIKNNAIKNLFLLAFSATLREGSYTRNNEFKLFSIKNKESFNPNINAIFRANLEAIINDYLHFYQPKIKNISLDLSPNYDNKKFDNILTSPPYGDSKTTVAYGQFSAFINEILGLENRRLDSKLLGGKKAKNLYQSGIIGECIRAIVKLDLARGLEVSGFYFDLEEKIKKLAFCAHDKVFFVVGNRRVKNIELATDRFIAEAFISHGFRHLATLKRNISNKSMPRINSPTNKAGSTAPTMNKEYIIVCGKG